MHRSARTVVAAVAVAGLVALTGCAANVNFPYWASLDKHNFVSTPNMPLTLTLVNSNTGQTVWSLDVPVGKMAVVDFDGDARWTPAQTPGMPADKIQWDLFDPGDRIGTLDYEKELDGGPVVLKVSVRSTEVEPGPGEPAESAEEAKSADEPDQPTAAEKESAEAKTSGGSGETKPDNEAGQPSGGSGESSGSDAKSETKAQADSDEDSADEGSDSGGSGGSDSSGSDDGDA